MKHKKRILLVGCGNLGLNLLGVWKDSFDLTVAEKSSKIINKLKKKKIKLIDLSNARVSNYNFVILCVKPKNIEEVGKLLSKVIVSNQMIISFMAGVKIEKLKKLFNTNNSIFRVMPNIFSGIGMGVNGLFTNKKVNKEKKSVEFLIKPLGRMVWLKKESDLDFFTAFYGGAPAYFFLFMNIMHEVIIKKNFYVKDSRSLIIKNLQGTLRFLEKQNKSFDKYIELVASKGGTTEEALNILKKNNALFNLFNNAILEATKKSESMGKKLI